MWESRSKNPRFHLNNKKWPMGFDYFFGRGSSNSLDSWHFIEPSAISVSPSQILPHSFAEERMITFMGSSVTKRCVCAGSCFPSSTVLERWRLKTMSPKNDQSLPLDMTLRCVPLRDFMFFCTFFDEKSSVYRGGGGDSALIQDKWCLSPRAYIRGYINPTGLNSAVVFPATPIYKL